MGTNIMKVIRFTIRKPKTLILVILLFTSISVHATDVRGRINFNARNGIFPMNGAFVQLCYIGGNCLSYKTGYDGMYYFRTQPGNYAILVNGREIFRLFIPNKQYYDIQELLGN